MNIIKQKIKQKQKEELLKCDLSELDSFDKDIKKVINEILGDNKRQLILLLIKNRLRKLIISWYRRNDYIE